MNKLSLEIDGKKIDFSSGQSILEVAMANGIEIPTLCFDPLLKSVGACRVCLVEETNSGRILASCVTPAAEGMVISTKSKAVLEGRRIVLELLMASHPDTCPICDKGNNCQLRELAAETGLGEVRFTKFRRFYQLEDANPFIERDLSKCILCGKCIRVCQEIPVIGAVDYSFRGFQAKPAAELDKPLEESSCEFCGACLYVCPVQALADKKRKYYGREDCKVDSVCPFCACGCSIKLLTRGNKVVRIVPNPQISSGKQALCPKGRFGYDFIQEDGRLTHPLIRKNGELVESSWEEAFDFIVQGIKKLHESTGQDSIGGIVSAKLTNEEIYSFYKMMEQISSLENIYNHVDYCLRPAVEIFKKTFNSAASNVTFDQLEQADLIILYDANIINSHPVASHAVRRAVAFGEADLVIIDPYASKLNDFAKLAIKPEIGTDSLINSALLKMMVDAAETDIKKINKLVGNIDDFKDSLKDLDIKKAASRSQVATNQIEQLYKLLKDANKTVFIFSGGLFQNRNGLETAESLSNLILWTQIQGQDDGGFILLSGHNNGQGLIDIESIFYENGKQFGINHFYKQLAGHEIRGLYIIGHDIINSLSDRKFLKEALAGLDLLIVQDIFLNETAELADVVLPAASFAEKEGSFINCERKTQTINKSVEAAGQARSDGQIFHQLAERLGVANQLKSNEQIREELKDCWPEFSLDGAMFYPFSEIIKEKEIEEYPLTLMTGRTLFHFGSGQMSSRSRSLQFKQPAGFVSLNSVDADALNIKDGQKVKVSSENGEVEGFLKIDNCLIPGLVFIPYNFKDLKVNDLLEKPSNNGTSTIFYKGLPVKVEKLGN